MSNQNSNKTDIDREVQSLLRKNTSGKIKNTYDLMEDLKSKFKDTDIVDSIMGKYNEKLERVKKLSRKIKERLVQKHPNLSTKEYIKKIEGYKEKYGFDDSEMSAIINMIFMDKKNIDFEVNDNMTYNEMSKALGFVPASYNLHNKLNFKKDEIDAIQGIIALHGMSKEIHNQVILSHLVHPGVCQQTLEAFPKYTSDKSRINVFEFVHPVVAALFLPKINILENHMLLASITNIVKAKYEGNDIATQPEYELYFDISTDPAETQCTTKVKPFTDLLARANVQTKLWEAVLQLRQGKPHTNNLQGFLTAIDQCRGSVFDAADMAFIKDEGTIMRKLLGAFSLRPIIVRTMPVYNSAGLGLSLPGMQNNMPSTGVSMVTNMVNVNTAQITTLSMVPLRIPFVDGSSSGSKNKFSLQSALQQTQLYIQNRQLSVKKQEILLAREFITFYINRRSQTFDFMKYLTPFSMSNLPISVNGLEQAITASIEFGNEDPKTHKYLDAGGHEQNFTISVGEQKLFALMSAVTVKTFKSKINNVTMIAGESNDEERNLIVGSKAYVRAFQDKNKATLSCDKMNNGVELLPNGDEQYLCYDPLQLGEGCENAGKFAEKNTFRSVYNGDDNKSVKPFNDVDPDSARKDIKNCGTLLIFVRCGKGANATTTSSSEDDEDAEGDITLEAFSNDLHGRLITFVKAVDKINGPVDAKDDDHTIKISTSTSLSRSSVLTDMYVKNKEVYTAMMELEQIINVIYTNYNNLIKETYNHILALIEQIIEIEGFNSVKFPEASSKMEAYVKELPKERQSE
jgi:hypothetical protein